MDNLSKKYNDGLLELGNRIKEKSPLYDVERMFGYVLGIVAAMDAIGHSKASEARGLIYKFIVPNRTKAFWSQVILPIGLEEPVMQNDDCPF